MCRGVLSTEKMALSRGPRQEHGGQCGWVEQNWKQNNSGFSPKFDMKLNN